MTRSSDNWHSTPGSFDALHADRLFPGDGNRYGIPSLAHTPLAWTPQQLVPYRTRLRSQQGSQGLAVHFFLDDYRFETVWSRSQKALEYLRDFAVLLTPDFSLYGDHPLTLQIWNTYRSRWCGAYWHTLGFKVIPTVSWSTPESYPFCFAGIPQRSLVALSTVGITDNSTRLFEQGYREMLARLQPSRVLCYGRLPAHLESLTEARFYDTHWHSRHGR